MLSLIIGLEQGLPIIWQGIYLKGDVCVILGQGEAAVLHNDEQPSSASPGSPREPEG